MRKIFYLLIFIFILYNKSYCNDKYDLLISKYNPDSNYPNSKTYSEDILIYKINNGLKSIDKFSIKNIDWIHRYIRFIDLNNNFVYLYVEILTLRKNNAYYLLNYYFITRNLKNGKESKKIIYSEPDPNGMKNCTYYYPYIFMSTDTKKIIINNKIYNTFDNNNIFSVDKKYKSVDISNNGKLLSAYNQHGSFGIIELYIINMNTSDKSKLLTIYPVFCILSGITYGYQDMQNKCWSPSDDEILFVGSFEFGKASVYTVNIKTKKVIKILKDDFDAKCFNPYLEWTKYGIVITCRENIYIKLKSVNDNKVTMIEIPDNITELGKGKISPDGKNIMFFGKKNEEFYLFIYNIKSKKIIESKIGKSKIIYLNSCWVEKGKINIMCNYNDYAFTDKAIYKIIDKLFNDTSKIKKIKEDFNKNENK